MEYFINKDKSIAFKIFELGMKKFGDEPKYVLAYLDYLSHLNGTYIISVYPVSVTL